MQITSVRHKGLRRFLTSDDSSGLPSEYVVKIRRMIAFLEDANTGEDVRVAPVWRAHQLTGDRKGTWALHVSPNWRLTFRVTGHPPEVTDLDLEDYH
jgi:proteic killer suppression protein